MTSSSFAVISACVLTHAYSRLPLCPALVFEIFGWPRGPRLPTARLAEVSAKKGASEEKYMCNAAESISSRDRRQAMTHRQD